MKGEVLVLAFTALASFLLTLIATPVVRRLALDNRIMDQPGERRVNMVPIPRLGGLAIGIGLLGSVLVPYIALSVYKIPLESMTLHQSVNYLGVTAGVFAAFILGLLDDLLDLQARHKLFGQLVASVLVVWSGVLLPSIGPVKLGVFSYPVTIFVLVSFMNMINLVDGLDGLSSGIVIMAAITGLVIAMITGSLASGIIYTTLSAACLGFFVYNKYPAKIFMGDAGAMSIGMVLGIASIILVADDPQFRTALSVLLPIGIPIIDTFTAIIRRSLLGTRVGNADKTHLHHRLLYEFGHLKAVSILHLLTAIFALLALMTYLAPRPFVFVSILAAVVLAIGIIYRFSLFSEMKTVETGAN